MIATLVFAAFVVFVVLSLLIIVRVTLSNEERAVPEGGGWVVGVLFGGTLWLGAATFFLTGLPDWIS